MSVMIRLSRQGAKKHPQYLVVAVDSAKKRDGAYLAKLGHYYPMAKTPKEKLAVDMEAVALWQKRGAQVTQTVGQLLKVAAK
ncbi:MAG: 30S ribosomal protein S16 [Bdellovibrionota bacterium]